MTERRRRRPAGLTNASDPGAPPPGLKVARFRVDGRQFALFSYPRAPPGLWERLSEAEGKVITQLLRGLSNREIAAVRHTSLRTVANQVASAFRRIGVSSRAELSAVLAGDRDR
jgi:DNA-binding CsgD family transcriptional regulator